MNIPETINQYFYTSGTGVIFIGGLISNILEVIIYLRKKFSKQNARTYYIASCLADSFSLLWTLTEFCYFGFNLNLSTLSFFSCQFINYTTYVSPAVSAWFMMTISLDRICMIFFANEFKFLEKLGVQIGVSIGILIFNLLFYSPSFEVGQFTPADLLSPNSTTNCEYNYNHALYKTLALMDLVNSSLLPFAIEFCSSICLCCFLIRARRRLKSQQMRNTVRNNASVSNIRTNSTNKVVLKKRDRDFIFTCLAVNFSFLAFTMPSVILNNGSVNDWSVSNELKYSYLYLLDSFSYAIQFPVNMITNSMFRVEFYSFLGIKRSRETENALRA